ncbi:hypothetical protein [Acidithiobacillus concretivorus]|uniref:Uncharacterized protein n=1 Tax=Acidithiobacillus concretivorus TaxID=3063952 RepID=A0ABS5ZTF5_9PROT|nr:hypothetical protein [Acidithiobacillus concretivorus]MBU2739871.1 hypothetical protein [Acidithiobacillus concretivorus]
MTVQDWNPKTALKKAVPFFRALPHLTQAHLTTTGGLTVCISFDACTSELVAFDDDDNELGRTPFEVTP